MTVTRWVLSPGAFSAWLGGDLRAASFARRSFEICVVGGAFNVPPEGLQALPPWPGRVVVAQTSLSRQEDLLRLDGVLRNAGIRLSANHVLLGAEPAHDSHRGRLPSFHQTMASVEALQAGGIEVSVTLALRPETVQDAFAAWHMLVRRRIPFSVSIGGAHQGFDGPARYSAMELLENIANHTATDPRVRYLCEALRRSMEGSDLQARRLYPELADLDPDGETERQAVAEGSIPPLLPPPPMAWRIRGYLHRLKADKWLILMRGLPTLGSLAVRRRLPGDGKGALHARPRALVLGWYGTETSGDKAILGGILEGLLGAVPELAVTVASLLPFYTRRSLEELGLGDRADVVPLDPARLGHPMHDYDLVMIGGGPLMDLVEMLELLRIFERARRAGARGLIAGCGIGPARWPITRSIVRALVDLSSEVVLRDRASLELLEAWGTRGRHLHAGRDPAIAYVADRKIPPVEPRRFSPLLGMAVRDWQWKFGAFLGKKAFHRRAAQLRDLWAELADWFVERLDGHVSLIPMHTLYLGGDDRWLQADIWRAMRHGQRVMPHLATYSAGNIASLISQCDVMVAMRYHSILFSIACRIPFVAVDYTGGGKVAALVREIGMEEYLVDPAVVTLGELQSIVEKVWMNRSAISGQLDAMRPQLIAESRLAGQMAATLLSRGGRP